MAENKVDSNIINEIGTSKINENKTSQLNNYLKNIFAILFWFYGLIKIFVFDIDIYIIEKVNPEVSWLITYKFLIFLTIVAFLWIFTRKNKFIFLNLYIIFYPFILIFWIFPKTVYKIGSWNFGIGTLNAFLSFFNSIKYNFLTFAGLVVSGDSGDKDHLIPEQIDQVIVWRKTEQISWRSF